MYDSGRYDKFIRSVPNMPDPIPAKHGLELLDERLRTHEALKEFDPSALIPLLIMLIQECKKPTPERLKDASFAKARLVAAFWKDMPYSDAKKAASRVYLVLTQATNTEVQGLIDDCLGGCC